MKAFKSLSIALLLTASFAMAQTTQNQKPADPKSGQSQPTPAGQQAQAPAAATAKRPPQAKSKAEYDAYVALIGLKDPAAMEKAADDFVAKYPDSELKSAAYQRAMVIYQQAGNDEKTLEMGRKSLAFNPDDPGVLVALADTLVQGIHETDLDKDERLSEATKYAQHSLETVTDFPAPPNMPAEQVAAVKNDLRSAAYAALGAAAYSNKKYPDAEINFKKAIEVTPSNPDPTTLLRLTLTLDKQNKYPEALATANKILAIPNLDPRVSQLTTQERDRLAKLVPAAKPATTPASTNAPAVPK